MFGRRGRTFSKIISGQESNVGTIIASVGSAEGNSLTSLRNEPSFDEFSHLMKLM